MSRLIWAPSALADVARLHSFLAPKNPQSDRRAIQAIRAGVRILQRYPEIGRPAETMQPEFREWMIEFGSSGYLVVYRYDGSDVVLLAIRHGREAEF